MRRRKKDGIGKRKPSPARNKKLHSLFQTPEFPASSTTPVAMAGNTAGGGADILRLPEELLLDVFSHTSARDACRLAPVCAAFRSVAQSEHLWDHLLRADFPDVLRQAIAAAPPSSTKKDLYLHLAGLLPPIIFPLKEDTVIYRERPDAPKHCILSARALRIISGDDPSFWLWANDGDAWFPEVAALERVWWLGVSGKVSPAQLSPDTHYGIYLVYKIAEPSFGLQGRGWTAEVRVRGDETTRAVVIDSPRSPRWRRGGRWLEVKIGRFYNAAEPDVGNVCFSFDSVDGLRPKKGLVVHGVELRPATTPPRNDDPLDGAADLLRGLRIE